MSKLYAMLLLSFGISQACENIELSANNIMRARQFNVPFSEVLDSQGIGLAGIIEDAFKHPVYSNPKNRLQATLEFGKLWRLECELANH